WLRTNLDEHLFKPAEAMAWRAVERRKARKTPLCLSWFKIKAAERRTRRRINFTDHCSTAAYADAIRKACKTAKVPAWSPNQLRHNAATNLRREHGIELARIILGHTTAFTTEIYAETDRRQAIEVIARVG